MVKNEEKYLLPFYQIHKFLGVQHFLFLDRTIEGKSAHEVFKGFPDVTVLSFSEPKTHAQGWAFATEFYKTRSKWVQYIDIDQVCVPQKTNDIKEMLTDYEKHPCLSLNWHSFGSNGHEQDPDNSYDSYTKRALSTEAINNHVQSIVQVQHIKSNIWENPHAPANVFEKGGYQVNEEGRIFRGPFNIPPTQNVGFIAHYYTRSKDYWAKKLAKTRADIPGVIGGALEDFEHHQSYMNKEDEFRVRDIWQLAKK